MNRLQVKDVLSFVWRIAQAETEHLSHEFVDTAHFLLSIVQTKRSGCASLLSAMNVHPNQIYEEVVKQIPPGEPMEPRGAMRPLTRNAASLLKEVPELLDSECRGWPVSSVAVVVMLRQEASVAQMVLSTFGLTENKVVEFQRDLGNDCS